MLTVHGCHRDFASSAAGAVGRPLQADAALFVDWSALPALNALRLQPAAMPVTFLCFRVFHTSSELVGADADLQFYRQAERDALGRACHTVALSAADASALEALAAAAAPTTAAQEVTVLLPPLRQDMADLAQRTPAARPRTFLTCCVRLSPEKGALRFVEAVERIGAARLAALGVTPALCGSASDAAYAAEVRRRLRRAAPAARIEERFLGGAELAELLVATRINVHPARNDAYGMTLVEAAAFGTPSLVSDDGSVGAVHLFAQGGAAAPRPAVLLADVSSAGALAQAIVGALAAPDELDAVGRQAQAAALAWDEASFGHALHGLLQAGRGDDGGSAE